MTSPEQSAVASAAVRPYRWVMLLLLWSLYASFGVTVASIAPLATTILDDLDMTYSQMGLILGAWQLVYVGTAFPLGALVDRLGPRRSLGIGIFIIWLSLVLRGLAGDFYTLFLAVALFGVGGPIISIGVPKAVSLWFEGNERGPAAGIYYTGSVIGSAIALATAAGVVMPLTGTWRGISLVYGAAVLFVVAMWWAFSRDVPIASTRESGQAEPQPTATRSVVLDLLRLRNMRLMMVTGFGTFFLTHGMTHWLPALLEESGMTIAQAGSWTAAATALGIFGLLAFPPLARHGYRALIIALLLAVAAVSIAGLAYLDGPPLIGGLVAYNIVRDPMLPILTLILMETPGVGARRMGVAGGLFFTAAEVGGFGGPFLLGLIRDVTGMLTAGVVLLAVVSVALVALTPFVQERRVGAAARRRLG